MEPIARLVGRMAPLGLDDVDTDQIMPKQFLTRTERTGFGEFLFASWRQEPGFVLNEARYQGASILVAGRNFGCGSSREHAVWGLKQYGFRAVVAASFSDIFAANCVQDGLIPVTAAEEVCRRLCRTGAETPETELAIDIDARRLRWDGAEAPFSIAEPSRTAILKGETDLSMILMRADRITAFEADRPSWVPSLSALT